VDLVRRDAIQIADKCSTHWKTNLATTGYTPRDMDVVMNDDIASNSEIISAIYRLPQLRKVLEAISLAQVCDMPEKNEELFLSRHRNAGNTHGWHWGDYSYAMCWILVAPPIEAGGHLQCVPHTVWHKDDKNIVNKYLAENKISTYPFQSGDIYYLKTDTTMHRTVPITQETLRVMLNMSWAGHVNAKKSMEGIEWWQKNEKAADGAGKFKPLGAKSHANGTSAGA
jgi:L-lysine 4-chlorinase